MDAPKIATRIVNELLEEMNNRRGFRQNWDAIDEETQCEIKREWRKLIANILRDEVWF